MLDVLVTEALEPRPLQCGACACIHNLISPVRVCEAQVKSGLVRISVRTVTLWSGFLGSGRWQSVHRQPASTANLCCVHYQPLWSMAFRG